MPVLRDDKDIKRVLSTCKTICVVGISPDPSKPSHFVSDVLMSKGFRLFLVNPNYEGQRILGQRVYSSLREIPDEIDILDVFRNPSAVPELAEEAKKKGFKTFWMQPGAENPEVIKELDGEGYNVVYGRCAKVESMRLL
jgi:predicted CoA-binding protein